MKVLITGIAGLLGSRLTDYIIENHPDVHIVGIDDLSGGYYENINHKVPEFRRLNLVTGDLESCFEEHKFDYVYHFAAYAAEGLSPFIRKYNYENNLISTTRIINQCIKHDVKRLVFTSTMAVYGHGYGDVFDEAQIPSPIDPYGIAKYACEMDIKVAGEQHGLDWCIIRPHNVYGIKQNIWDKYRNVLGIWMYQHMNGEPMTIFGDGEQKRAFSYIDDCLEGLWKASQLPECSKEIINLGGTKHYTINEANKILREVINGGETIHKEQRHEVKTAVPTWAKSVRLLGYEDKTSLHDGLKSMWEWAQQQPKRDRFVWDSYELDKGIYSFWKK
jgi:UDP-glucose 4-epimerase